MASNSQGCIGLWPIRRCLNIKRQGCVLPEGSTGGVDTAYGLIDNVKGGKNL